MPRTWPNKIVIFLTKQLSLAQKSIPQLTANDTRQHIIYELYIIPSV